VLCGGDGIAERRVHDNDAARGGGRNVDIVDADAGAPDHFEVLCLLQQLGRYFRGRTNCQALVIADYLGKLVLVDAGLHVDRDAVIPENLHGGGRKRVGDENARSHFVCFLHRPVEGRVGPNGRGELFD
jgi:hypothetical protein